MANLNMELNLSFLPRTTTLTSIRKSLMSEPRRNQRHRRCILEKSQTGLDIFKTVIVEDVITAVRASPSKQCASLLLQTSILKEVITLHPTSQLFQHVDYRWMFSTNMVARYCYAIFEESWGRRVVSIKLSSGLKSTIPFEIPRRNLCQPSTYRLPQRVSLVSNNQWSYGRHH